MRIKAKEELDKAVKKATEEANLSAEEKAKRLKKKKKKQSRTRIRNLLEKGNNRKQRQVQNLRNITNQRYWQVKTLRLKAPQVHTMPQATPDNSKVKNN